MSGPAIRAASADEQRRGFRRLAIRQPTERGAEHGPLAGVTFGVKENIDVAGFPTQAGLRAPPAPASADAPCVARLRTAGAVLVGQTAMDEAALGSTTDNPHYGRTMNPRRDGFTPGGSSGGSGAAVASGAVRFALGTDTLGSVRIPAAYCGIVGFKPGFGRIDTAGVRPLAPSFDHVGVLADSVATAAAAFRAMAGPPPQGASDPATAPVIGVPDGLAGVELEPAVRDDVERALAVLRDRGFAVRPLRMPGWIPTRARKASFLLIEAEAATVYARAIEDPDAPLSDRLRGFLRYGRDCAPDRLDAARAELARVRAAVDAAFAGVDLLALPTCPQVAFSFDVPPPVNQGELTALANIAGVPAISLPIEAGELPVGLQLVAPRGADERLLALAAEIAPLIGP